MACQFLLVPIYLKYFSKSEFGTVVMLIAFVNYAAIGITWLSGGAARLFGEYITAKKYITFTKLYIFCKYLYVSYAIITILFCWFFLIAFSRDIIFDQDVFHTILCLSIYFLILYEYNTDRLALNAFKLQKKANMYEILGQVVTFFLAIYLLDAGLGMKSVPISMIGGIVICRLFIFCHWKNHRSLNRKSRLKFSQLQIFWKKLSGSMGRDYLFYGILLLIFNADMFVLGLVAGSAVAADFYLLWRIPEAIILLIGRVPGTLTPYLISLDASQRRDELIHLYSRILWLLLIISFLFSLSYSVFGRYILTIWIGDEAPMQGGVYVLAGLAMFFLSVIQWPSTVSYALVNMRPLLCVTLLFIVFKFLFIFASYNLLGYLAPLAGVVAIQTLGIFIFYLSMGKKSITRINSQNEART